ncbi:LOW QUALITY PROTEIN: huntingtin-interacting protein 1-like [Ptychodera flava]|uniref:LOW QUALITY PROTEIN: huntingtin-interacting protein 1-like n=1 Tax=Ptychodera flava TaxID=63121 RepID=UPI00396A443C
MPRRTRLEELPDSDLEEDVVGDKETSQIVVSKALERVDEKKNGTGDKDNSNAISVKALQKLTTSINKAINSNEVPVKEKHCRSAIIGTFQEKGAGTYWSVCGKLPLQGNPIVCWKFCHVCHKVLREGHPNALTDSQKYKTHIEDLGKMWGHLQEGYGKLIAAYTLLIITKLEFHLKNPKMPGNLQMSADELDQIAEGDVNNFFQLSVELFDYLDAVLATQDAVFNSFDPARSNSMTSTGQCRLAPLIPMIQDSSALYDLSVKILFKLHACLPPDTLSGHRERFRQQFKALKEFFRKASNLQYFKRLIQVPTLPANPPNFLIASDYNTHVSPVVVMAHDDDVDSVMTPESPTVSNTSSQSRTPVDETLVMFEQSIDTFSDNTKVANIFENDNFGATTNGQHAPPLPPFPQPTRDERDDEIEQLRRDLAILRRQMNEMKDVDQRLIDGLKRKLENVEELLQQREEEVMVLRKQLEQSTAMASKVPQEKVVELEKKAKVNEEKFKKMKDVYTSLREEHLQLLRKNAETAKQLTAVTKISEENDKKHQDAEEMIEQLQTAVKEKETVHEALIKQNEDLEKTLLVKSETEDTYRKEIDHLQNSLEAKIVTEKGLKMAEEGLQKTVNERLAAEDDLKKRMAILEKTVSEKTMSEDELRRQAAELQKAIADRQAAEERLKKKMEEDSYTVLVNSVEEAEDVIKKALEEMENPQFSAATCTAEYLLTRFGSLEQSLNSVKRSYDGFADDNSVVSTLIRSVAGFSHSLSDFILHGKATSHMAPLDQGEKLSDTCKSSGEKALELLAEVKQKNNKDKVSDRQMQIQLVLKQIQSVAEELLIKEADVGKQKLGDTVEDEMQTTAACVDEAVSRIEQMLNKSREESSGVRLEVNERILDACTQLMKDIKVLINRSKVLQSEIVEHGRGTSTSKDFYARHSRWTEGLISASKAVGWGASVLVDTADKLLQGNGKFEELIACSHEIAASTAQLVAASRVKAERDSKSLPPLQTASRKVAESTATVVATAKTGAQMIEEQDTMDFSNMSLMDTKRMEMESQVKVLELESKLERERRQLANLRKQHYQLAGESEGWDEEDQEAANVAARN